MANAAVCLRLRVPAGNSSDRPTIDLNIFAPICFKPHPSPRFKTHSGRPPNGFLQTAVSKAIWRSSFTRYPCPSRQIASDTALGFGDPASRRYHPNHPTERGRPWRRRTRFTGRAGSKARFCFYRRRWSPGRHIPLHPKGRGAVEIQAPHEPDPPMAEPATLRWHGRPSRWRPNRPNRTSPDWSPNTNFLAGRSRRILWDCYATSSSTARRSSLSPAHSAARTASRSSCLRPAADWKISSTLLQTSRFMDRSQRVAMAWQARVRNYPATFRNSISFRFGAGRGAAARRRSS